MQTDTHFWLYFAHFFLEWEMCQTKIVEKISPVPFFFFSKTVPFMRLEKFSREGQATDGNIIWRMRISR